jgi:hypothetical protein
MNDRSLDIGLLYQMIGIADGKRVEKPWGYEVIYSINDQLYIKYINVNDGFRVSQQHHPRGAEMIMILEGEGTIEGTPDMDLNRPRPSMPYFIAPGMIHRSIGPVQLIEFTTAGPNDIVRHEDDFGREGTVGA